MKSLFTTIILSLLAFSFSAMSAPQYSLQSICVKYGKVGQCSTVPFCQETRYESGCYLARGAAAYMEGLCKLQTTKQGCDIMAAQGNCAWVDRSGSVCDARFESL